MVPEAQQARPRIGRYLITGVLGKGGMGMVYRGLDEKLEREVAIKTITTTGAVPEESQRRFEIEAKAAARMQHPNIVAVYELSEDRGVRFIAMELLRGTDLDALLRSQEEVLLAEKLEIAIQVCRGLAYAHERGVFHRDIKPANIGLLEDDGTAKIMDFGIAKLEGTQLTKTGMMVGTVNYMSPEQVQGDKKLDGRTDIFSMGVILYQLLSGERPFQGDSVTQVLYKIVKEPPAPLELSSLGEVGPRLASIVERALAKNREERYQTAKELADSLQRVLDDHRREVGAVDPGVLDAITAARRKVRAGQVDERLVAQLETIVASSPSLVDARRALRTARRLKDTGSRPQVPPEELLTQLASTFQSAPTRVAPSPDLDPTVVADEARADSGGRRRVLLALGAVVLALGAAGVFLLRGGGQAAPPAPVEVRIPVRSLPVGAAVWVDGRDSGVVTNDELVLPEPVPEQVELAFRKAGHRAESRTVRLPLAPGETVSVTLESATSVTPVRTSPAGATVTVDGERVAGVTPLEISLDPESGHVLGFALDGYLPREVRIVAGEMPEVVETSLEPLPPPGRLSVVSGYPLDVVWRGRTLARGTAAPQVELASGPQVVTLAAPNVFLRRDYQVTVPAGGRTAIEAPGLGEINVRALPDNCEVLIGGAFVDYPPILDRQIVVGPHTVTFRWPDGATREYPVEIGAGRPTFVTGKKE
jgi:predicted Ser/Thr protein kinase